MARAHDIAFLKLLCTSGIDVMTQMPLVSESLKRLIPSFSLSMIRVDQRCAPQEHFSEFFDEFSHRLFAGSGGEFAARSDDPAAFGNLLRHRQPYGTLIGTTPEYLAGATCEHLFKRNGIHHVLDVALRAPGTPYGILGIFREEKAPPFTRADVAVVSELYPHLVHAMATRGHADDGAFDELDSALLIVDPRGAIQWASAEARFWLEDATGGPERVKLMDHDLLPEACRALCQVWAQNQRSALRPSQTPTPAPTLTLPLPGGRLRLRAYGLAPHQHGENARAYIGIQLSLEMSRELRVLRALAERKLTPQQSRIALAYWRGHTPKEIRALIGVSASTLKSYQRDLYGRLDVNSAAELVEELDEHAASITFDLRRHRPRQARDHMGPAITPR